MQTTATASAGLALTDGFLFNTSISPLSSSQTGFSSPLPWKGSGSRTMGWPPAKVWSCSGRVVDFIKYAEAVKEATVTWLGF